MNRSQEINRKKEFQSRANWMFKGQREKHIVHLRDLQNFKGWITQCEGQCFEIRGKKSDKRIRRNL